MRRIGTDSLAAVALVTTAALGWHLIAQAAEEPEPTAPPVTVRSEPAKSFNQRIAEEEIARLTAIYPPTAEVTWDYPALAAEHVYGRALDDVHNTVQISSDPLTFDDGEPLSKDRAIEEVKQTVRHELAHQITYQVHANATDQDHAESEVQLELLFTGTSTPDIDGWEASADVIAAALNNDASSRYVKDYTPAQLDTARAYIADVTTLAGQGR